MYFYAEAPPPVSPKPIALISPEKLPFRERIAIYQAKVTSEEEKASYRRSWAPGISSPRSRSLSPVYNKWPSASYIGRASPTDSSNEWAWFELIIVFGILLATACHSFIHLLVFPPPHTHTLSLSPDSVSAADKENQLILPNPVTSRVVEVKDEVRIVYDTLLSNVCVCVCTCMH